MAEFGNKRVFYIQLIVMKKIFAIIGIASLAFTSCTKDDTANDFSKQTIIKATFEQDASSSRLNIATNNALTWSTGDAFALFGEGSSAKFTLQGDGGSATGEFAGTTPATILGAAFPYTSEYNPSFSGSTLSITLPAELDQSANGKCNLPMWAATSSVDNISFKHLAGVLRINLNDAPVGYNSLTVTASAPIAGTFTADTSADVPVLEASQDATNALTVSFAAATADANDNVLYIPLPVGTYSSLNVTISNGTDVKELITYNNKTVERAKIYTASLTYSSVVGSIATEVSSGEELAEALVAGKPVVLTEDIDLTEAITIPESVSTAIDLNGKTLTFAAPANPVAVASATRGASSKNGITNTGNLTINNGTIVDEVNDYTIYNNQGQVVLNNVNITSNHVAVYNNGVWGDDMTVQKYKGTDAAVKFTMNGGSITSTTDVTSPNIYAIKAVDYCLIDIKNATIAGTKSAGGLSLNCAEAKLDNVVITRGTEGTAHQVHLIAGILTYTNTDINNYRYYYGDDKGLYGYAEVNGVYYGEVNQVVENPFEN